jgi:catechol 2,3-dioxygenase-like lactoylglutathione lyase family enzyme
MITSAVATLFVADMDRAVRFYTESLGMALQYRAGNEWAQIDAGGGFGIGLHPKEADKPAVPGSIQIGLNVDEPLEGVIAKLTSRGVVFAGPIKADGPIRLAFFKDPDGHVLYLCEYRG